MKPGRDGSTPKTKFDSSVIKNTQSIDSKHKISSTITSKNEIAIFKLMFRSAVIVEWKSLIIQTVFP
ncbi:hypothetical protein Hanom_Chr09g00801261 [Helianthus anomalus]